MPLPDRNGNLSLGLQKPSPWRVCRPEAGTIQAEGPLSVNEYFGGFEIELR
jgi:hypothetical protein